MDFNMFLTLWFTLLWGSGSIYYQHCTVSVSYQLHPSFRQNAGELKAGRIASEDIRKAGNGARLAEPRSRTLKLSGESSFLNSSKKFIHHSKAKAVTFERESGICTLCFSFLLQFRAR